MDRGAEPQVARAPWLRRPPHAWQPGLLDRAALQQAAASLAAKPGFDAVARRFAQCWIDTQDSQPALRTVLRNSSRYLMLVACLVLHHGRDPADPLSGITPGRVHDFFERQARGRVDAGASQIKAMLGHARVHGLLQERPGTGDARFRPLAPTPLLEGAMQRWVAGFLQAMDGCLPLPAASDDMAGVPGLVGEVFTYRLAALTHDRFVLTEGQDATAWLMSRDRGYRLFLHLVRLMQVQPDGSAVVSTGFNDLAALARVSRGTVRNLFLELHAQGWFSGGPASQQLVIDQAHVRLALHWVALELVWMHGLASAAWERLASV